MRLNEELLREILSWLDTLDYVKPEQIPDIPLYMDQLTTFMDERLEKTRRYPEDKVLTKTMINNYAKNNLLPPPVKKKYTKEHTLLLLFIYYFKNMLSFKDIEILFAPITEEHFVSDHKKAAQSHETETSDSPDSCGGWSLEDVYREIFSLEKEQMRRLKEDILKKFRSSMKTFSKDSSPGAGRSDCGKDGQTADSSTDSQTVGSSAGGPDSQARPSDSDQEYLQLFSFICALGFDVYLKKHIMELLIDEIEKEYPPKGKKKK